jgi:cyclic pyranopterin phosphate synthase
MTQLTHLDSEGSAHMVDVAHKPDQRRTAIAEGFLTMAPATLDLVRQGLMKKGEVRAVAVIAGIGAAKETWRLIPLCHHVQLSSVDVDVQFEERGARVCASARCTGQTGVEMEALMATSVALLAIYDMCKAVDKQMEIISVKLLEKRKE